MVVHNTHPKRDLIEIVELFEIFTIEDYRDLSKKSLASQLWTEILKIKCHNPTYIQPDSDNYFVDDVSDLIQYLRKPSPNQLCSKYQREVVNDKVKNLIFYSIHCAYSIPSSNYECMDDIREDASYIRTYGDIPSVRRALRLLNKDIKMDSPIEPVMTKRTKVRVEAIKQHKINSHTKLSVIHKPIELSFD
tara:strand:- start:309 stop:881 length:573 start_codon:yes stop_codon:yes gene_type:complete